MTEPVRLSTKAVYRVHVEGMNPTESKIFAGAIHLAERNGTVFQVEAALENSDIFIFDGTSQRAIEFEKSHRHIAQSTIWIDPPANLQSPRQIRRPFRWSSLLEMMEQIVGGDRKPGIAVRSQSAANISFDGLCALTDEILRKHIGVAAAFVIEDVRAESRRLAGATATEPTTVDAFLDILKRQLPSNVDASEMVREISSATGLGMHE